MVPCHSAKLFLCKGFDSENSTRNASSPQPFGVIPIPSLAFQFQFRINLSSRQLYNCGGRGGNGNGAPAVWRGLERGPLAEPGRVVGDCATAEGHPAGGLEVVVGSG